MSEELDEIVGEFIVESYESLDELDRELVTLEQQANPDLIARIFRAIHTIKGTSGFLGFTALESVTHVGENLLSKLRDGDLQVTERITTALLAMADAVRDMLTTIERTGSDGGGSYADLIAELARLESGQVEEPAVAAEPDPTPEPDVVETAQIELVNEAEQQETAVVEQPTLAVGPAVERIETDQIETEPTEMADHSDTIEGPEMTADADRIDEPDVTDEPELTGEPEMAAVPVVDQHEAKPVPATAEDRSPAAESIRVDVGLLDDLMNLVGELVLARNQILQFTSTQSDANFAATSQRLNLITTELQEGVMRTRMQPIENVWNKFPRVVRDLSVACGKKANLVMEGKHTELDKTLLEAIKDPLTHLVRNSVDHGLEMPDARARAGKPEEGTVKLRAYHEGGQVIIEIADDGNGIDPAVLRRKAVEKGLFGSEEAASKSDREILSVIFQPGFSTAEKVTNISGRGVGMDVVRTNIESIGGSVDVQSTIGVGTTFKVKIPLTLAIIPALVVTCEGDRFAIPQVSLLELVRIDGPDPQHAIEYVHGAPVYRLRGRLLPIVYLHEVFGRPAPTLTDGVNIVVLQADDRQFGLVVDEISDTAEIVVKPLGRILKQVSAFAGATIMGDGRVALILDVLGIAEHIGMSSTRDTKQSGSADSDAADGAANPVRRILMFRLGDRRFALFLDRVARLEEFTPDQVEATAGGEVVQYRGEIMPLVRLADQLSVGVRRNDDGPLQAVVCLHGERSVGVVVDDIFDVLEQTIVLQRDVTAHGVLGSAVIQDRVTDILDLESVLEAALPGLLLEVAA